MTAILVALHTMLRAQQSSDCFSTSIITIAILNVPISRTVIPNRWVVKFWKIMLRPSEHNEMKYAFFITFVRHLHQN
jgi:hypothetical protein